MDAGKHIKTTYRDQICTISFAKYSPIFCPYLTISEHRFLPLNPGSTGLAHGQLGAVGSVLRRTGSRTRLHGHASGRSSGMDVSMDYFLLGLLVFLRAFCRHVFSQDLARAHNSRIHQRLYGSEQPRIGTEVLGHPLFRLLALLTHLLATPLLASLAHSAALIHSLAHSLSPKLVGNWMSRLLA